MSLVKKALKDAEAARPKKAAPFTGPQMMTVDSPPRAGYSNFGLVVLIAVTMVLSGVMMWKWFRAGNGDLKVRARSYDSAVNPVSASTARPTPAPVSATPKETTSQVEPVKPVAEKPPVIVASSLPVVTPPKPITYIYKLQGITYAPGHSSAVINGQTVMAGERVDGATIIKVDKDTVTLVNPRGETNLLEVP